MNIDERLEALTHTIELLAGMHKDVLNAQQQTEAKMQELTVKMSIMTDTVNRLGIGFEDYEHRIPDLREVKRDART